MINLFYFTISVLLAICFSLVYKLWSDNKQRQKEKQIRSYLNSIVSLSISHLHDASNFFSLLKGSLAEKELIENASVANKEKLFDLRNFSRGASFHFRSLFEELKNSKKLFDHSDFDLLLTNNFNLLYKKEKINLKDLMELELFQVSDFKRLKLIDKSKKDYAWIYGNFSLLSKVLLNLIENALKYTEKEITIELNDYTTFFELKIISLGEGIPERIVNNIKDSSLKKFYGHGFESTRDIIDFHDADLDISTISGSGSCVTLRFNPFNDQEAKSQEVYDSLQSNLTFPVQLKWMIPSGIVAVIFLAALINLTALSNSYNALFANTEIQKPIVAKVDKVLVSLSNSLKENKVKNYHSEEDKFLKNFDESKHHFVSLLLLEKVRITDSPFIEDFLIEKSLELYNDYPDSVSLNYSLSELYFKKKKFLPAFVYSARGLMSLIKQNLFPSKDLYYLNRVFKELKVSELMVLNFSKDAQLLKKPKRRIIAKPVKKAKPKPQKTPQEKNIDKAKAIVSDKEINSELSVDELIEQQDKQLGIDFDL